MENHPSSAQIIMYVSDRNTIATAGRRVIIERANFSHSKIEAWEYKHRAEINAFHCDSYICVIPTTHIEISEWDGGSTMQAPESESSLPPLTIIHAVVVSSSVTSMSTAAAHFKYHR